jgi:hypothetical protein
MDGNEAAAGIRVGTPVVVGVPADPEYDAYCTWHGKHGTVAAVGPGDRQTSVEVRINFGRRVILPLACVVVRRPRG